MMKPPRKHKLLFWLLLACLSMAFAEVVAGSYLFPFLTVWGTLVLVPLYGLHILVLAGAVFRFGRPTLSTVYPAGMLFGMYEAYITKVLWDPTWGNAVVTIGGVAVVESALLVLFWHAVLAFIVPLMVGERLATTSSSVLGAMPSPVKRLLSDKRVVLAGFACGGAFQAVNSPSILHSLASGLSTGAVILLLIYLWKRSTRDVRYSLDDLLPNKRELCTLVVPLLGIYLLFGIAMRPEALPGLGPQAVIWLAYAAIGGLWYVGLRRSRTRLQTVAPLNAQISRSLLVGAPAVFAGASAIAVSIVPAIAVAYVLYWLGLVACGGLLLVLSVKDALAPRPAADSVGTS